MTTPHIFQIICIIFFIGLIQPTRVYAKGEIFTNAFLVKMKQPADRSIADGVAARNGFVNLGSVSLIILVKQFLIET